VLLEFAAGVVQLIDFGTRLLSDKTAKIYRFGTSPGYVDLELVAAALSKVTAALDVDVHKASIGGKELSANENDVQQLRHECLNIAQRAGSLSSLSRGVFFLRRWVWLVRE
jgi:hypothetical protein